MDLSKVLSNFKSPDGWICLQDQSLHIRASYDQDLLYLFLAIRTSAEVACTAYTRKRRWSAVQERRAGLELLAPFVGQASSCLNWSLCAEWMAGGGGRDAQNCWQELKSTDAKLTC